jgi:hypothetical protein
MPFIIPLIMAVATAAEVGLGIHSAVAGGGGGGATPTPTTPTTPPPNVGAQKTALLQQAPTLQSNLGGSVSPEYYLKMMEILSGQAGQPGIGQAGQNALQTLFGGGGQPSTGTSLTAGGVTTAGAGTPGLVPSSSSLIGG